MPGTRERLHKLAGNALGMGLENGHSSQPSGNGTGEEKGQTKAGHYMKHRQCERLGNWEPQLTWSGIPAQTVRIL